MAVLRTYVDLDLDVLEVLVMWPVVWAVVVAAEALVVREVVQVVVVVVS